MAKHKLRKFVEEYCANYLNHTTMGGWHCIFRDSYTEEDGFNGGKCLVICGEECAYFTRAVFARSNCLDKNGKLDTEKWFSLKDSIDKLKKREKVKLPLTQIHTFEQLSQFLK